MLHVMIASLSKTTRWRAKTFWKTRFLLKGNLPSQLQKKTNLKALFCLEKLVRQFFKYYTLKDTGKKPSVQLLVKWNLIKQNDAKHLATIVHSCLPVWGNHNIQKQWIADHHSWWGEANLFNMHLLTCALPWNINQTLKLCLKM